MTESNRPEEPGDKPPGSDGSNSPAGWVDRLAQRSTGLHSNASKPVEKNSDASLWSLAGLGLQFGGTVVLFLLIGRWIDDRMNWKFGATLTLLAMALIGNFYLLIKSVNKRNK